MRPLELELLAVSHRFPGRDRDTPGPVSFRVGPGERRLLVGPNGSGKTTLLRRVVGLLDGPGEVRLDGAPVSRGALRAVRHRVGFLWQNPDDALLLPTVLEDVAFGPHNDGLAPHEARARAGAWLERLGAAHLAQRAVRELSLGEKQVVSLAGVLAREPGLLLLDEPAAALDREARQRLLGLLAGLPATLLVVTHEPRAWTADGGWGVAAELA